jgi:hypothetical protein
MTEWVRDRSTDLLRHHGKVSGGAGLDKVRRREKLHEVRSHSTYIGENVTSMASLYYFRTMVDGTW